MGLLSKEGFLSEGLSVIGDVFLEVVDLGLDLISSGNKQAVNQVFGSCNVGFSTLDVHFEGNDQRVVLVSSDIEVEF